MGGCIYSNTNEDFLEKQMIKTMSNNGNLLPKRVITVYVWLNSVMLQLKFEWTCFGMDILLCVSEFIEIKLVNKHLSYSEIF